MVKQQGASKLNDATSAAAAAETPWAPAHAPLPTEAERRTADLASEGPMADEAQARRQARIREAAYATYERRGGQAGHEVEDWLEAERAIDEELGRRGSREGQGV